MKKIFKKLKSSKEKQIELVKDEFNLKSIGFENLMENKYLKFYGNKENNYFKVVQKYGGVVILPYCSKTNRLLLIENYRDQLGKDMLELPRGFVEPNEEFVDAAIRELKEETGLSAKNVSYLSQIHTDSGILNDEIHIFSIEVDSEEQLQLDVNENIFNARWIDNSKYIELLLNGSIQDSLTISSITLFNEYSNKK